MFLKRYIPIGIVAFFGSLTLFGWFIDNESVEWNGKNFALTESVVKQNNAWRLSLQTHKWMGID